MYLPRSDTLAIDTFSGLFADMSESYKIFWFNGILDGINKGQDIQTFEQIINHMMMPGRKLSSKGSKASRSGSPTEKLPLRGFFRWLCAGRDSGARPVRERRMREASARWAVRLGQKRRSIIHADNSAKTGYY